MRNLRPRTIESSPDGSKEHLKAVQLKNGFIPNLMATFGNSPAVLEGYLSLESAWDKCSLTAIERQAILLTASVENKCTYCIALHSSTLKGMGFDAHIIKAIRHGERLGKERLDALVNLTRELVTGRGFVAERTKERFMVAGYNEVAAMEVLVGVALKTISNYLDHLAPISIDAVFQPEVH
jgi:AhpD family alkylhydroperoxidase